MEPNIILQLILDDWGLDHQGAVRIGMLEFAAEARYSCHNDSLFLFALNNIKLACDWVDAPHRDPWSVAPPKTEPVFTVNLCDPESIDNAMNSLFSYMRDKRLFGGGSGKFFEQVFKHGTGCAAYNRAHEIDSDFKKRKARSSVGVWPFGRLRPGRNCRLPNGNDGS